jgi:hypothetical protein
VAKGRIELPTLVLDINKAFTKNIKLIQFTIQVFLKSKYMLELRNIIFLQ